MNKNISTLLLLIGIIFLTFFVFRIMSTKEGMTNGGENNSFSSSNGVAGGSANYSANIKANVIKMQDTLLISKYRTDYENTILNLDDLVNNLMLTTVLNIDQENPQIGLEKLVKLSESKLALNNVMKFVDSK
jgi:hypothetical protein